MDTSGSVHTGRRFSEAMGELTKPQLQRLLAQLSERCVNSPDSSRDFHLRSMQWLTDIKSHQHEDLRLECLEACAKYFYRNADQVNLLKAVNQFDRLAESSKNKKWRRKAQSYLGIAYADAGDYYRSLLSYCRALRIAREMGDKCDEAIVLLNMGTALMTAGLYADSMRAFERAFEVGMSDAAHARFACSSASNMAQNSCFQGRYEAGIAHVATALRLDPGIPREQYDLHRVVLEQVYVQLAVGVGDSQLARKRLQLCEQFAARSQSTRAAVVAKLARGLYEVEFGDATAGESLLRSVVQLVAPKSFEWVDAQLFLIHALEKLGKIEDALDCADQLAGGLAQLSEYGAQALTQEHELHDIPVRADGLNKLDLQRSRLEAKLAHRQAALARWETVERLSMASELKADPSGMHGRRVGKLSGAFARHLGLKPDSVQRIEVAGRLHDIGKIAIPDKLSRASMLGRVEREVVNSHTKIGGDLLSRSAMPELQCAELVARHHHERWDGKGFPSQMAGKRIPVACRIVAIADCFDAMVNGRPQVRPVSIAVALAEIKLQAGTQFDPELAVAFEAFMRDLASKHASVQEYLQRDAKGSPLAATIAELNGLLAQIPHSDRLAPR